jgi:circadian clock protein KaiB
MPPLTLGEPLMPPPDNQGASAGGSDPWLLRLYVVGDSPKCLRAIENLRCACRQHLDRPHEIEIVDLLENPRRAADDQVLAVPTLVRRAPKPVRKIVGDLSDTDRLLAGLQLPQRKDPPT